MKYLELIGVLIFVLGVNSREHSEIGEYHKISAYLGHNLVLRDGCPTVSCDPKRRSCIKINLQIEARYEKCLR